MALRLKKLTKLNPGTCTHYRAEMNLDGQIEAVEVSLYELDELFRNFPGGHKQALILGLMNYRLEKGVKVSRLVDTVKILEVSDGD